MIATEAKWKDRVTAWRASGKTADAFAADGDFEASTLRYWASRLKSRKAEPPIAGAPPKSTVAMARVVRRHDHAASAVARRREDDELVVVIGTARIALSRGFDPGLLREVVAALGGEK